MNRKIAITSRVYRIYRITNDVNDKVYIGRTSDDTNNLYSLLRRVISGTSRKNGQFLIYDAMCKIGRDHFSLTILETTTADCLFDRYRYWTHYYNSIYPAGYNVRTI